MNTEGLREPLNFKVLLRYKFLIISVAAVVICGGYLRIVTEPRQYSATARIKVRFSADVLNLPEVGGNVRIPILEEEVKAYMTLLRAPRLIDLALQELEQKREDAAGGNNAAPPPEEEITTGEILIVNILDFVDGLKGKLGSMLDSLLLVKDTFVSNRERKVLRILNRLSVEAGVDASHIITLTYRDGDPTRAATIANAVTTQFMALQKAQTRKRNVERLSGDVEAAKKHLGTVIQRKWELATLVRSTSIEKAMEDHYLGLETLRQTANAIRNGLALLDAGIIPMDRTLPIETGANNTQLDRVFYEQRVRAEGALMVETDRTDVLTRELDVIERLERELKDKKIQAMKLQLEAHQKYIESEQHRLASDNAPFRLSPDFSALQVEEQTAQGNLVHAQQQLTDGQLFNQQLEQENVAEFVAVWQEAKPPPFPDQQRRLLKLVVIIVLGSAAGFAAALARHLLWPRPELVDVGAGLGGPSGSLNVPVIILPEEEDDDLESDLEFDVTFPEEEPTEGSRS